MGLYAEEPEKFLGDAFCSCYLICTHSSSDIVTGPTKKQMQSNPVTLFAATQICQELTVSVTVSSGMSP